MVSGPLQSLARRFYEIGFDCIFNGDVNIVFVIIISENTCESCGASLSRAQGHESSQRGHRNSFSGLPKRMA